MNRLLPRPLSCPRRTDVKIIDFVYSGLYIIVADIRDQLNTITPYLRGEYH